MKAAGPCPGETDRGHHEAADRDDPVVTERPAGNARNLAELMLGLPRREGAELKVDRDVPALPVQARGIDQMEKVRAEGEGAVTASTDSVVPARALRTGTAARPRPGSSA